MKYFSADCVSKAYAKISEGTKDKFWGILAILQSIDYIVKPNVSYNIDAVRLSTFLENTFRFKDKKSYENSNSEYSVVFSSLWIEKTFQNFLNGKTNIYPIIVWAYRRCEFEYELSASELLTKFITDFHISKEAVEELFTFDSSFKIEYIDTLYDDIQLLMDIKGEQYDVNKTTLKMGKDVAVANAGDLSRGPFFQPLYASLNTLECLTIYPFNLTDYYSLFQNNNQKAFQKLDVRTVSFDKNLLTAMRTKPFLLLAGISGTGKSRIVKQMAFECCPETVALRTDKTSPGNYQLIEVKPNWHDSTEVLGYESEISGKHYVVTPFVKFLVKAMCYEDKAPFFVCMDEMNLAPVEQYFAEFLSVLESRKLVDGKITSEPLIKADIFKKYGNDLKAALFDLKKAEDNIYGTATSDEAADYGSYNEVYDRLMTEGLRLPSNLIVVGTVNMDETTHQFSRKVIDRAMTIEMNIEDEETPFIDFFGKSGDLSYPQEVQPKELFLPTVVQASEAMAQLPDDDSKHLQDNIPAMLLNLNKALNGTPFKIAYRVQNELVLYYHALRKEQPDTPAEELLAKAMEAILMLKVLPRIEGDEDLLKKPLDKLAEFVAPYPEASKKVAEMQTRLKQAHFASFWP